MAYTVRPELVCGSRELSIFNPQETCLQYHTCGERVSHEGLHLCVGCGFAWDYDKEPPHLKLAYAVIGLFLGTLAFVLWLIALGVWT